MSKVSYFTNANNVVAKNLTFNTYISEGEALQFLYNHSATGAMHDSDERFPPPMCHPETRQAVVARIIAWYGYLTAPQKRIMWVHAPAGYGKTAVAGTISKILEEQGGLDFCPLGATFFFWRTSAERNSPACFVVTIAYQLAMSIPELKPHIENAVKQNPMILRKALETQLVKLIVEPFKALGQHLEEMPNRLIIVDGLDECINSNQESRVEKQYAEDQEKVQVRVLDLIHTLQSHQFPLSFLVLSRPESWLKQHIEAYPFKNSVEVLDLYETGDHMNDVETYIRAELSRIARTINPTGDDQDLEWPGENVVQRFIARTQGHMLYASTVIGHIDVPYEDPRSRLDSILDYDSNPQFNIAHSTPFASLYQLYRQILQSCPINSLPLMVQVLEDLVGTALFPLSLAEALPVLDSLSGRSKGSGLRALRGLHALLHLRASESGRGWFVHSSFATFLSDPQSSLEFTASRTKGHRRILSGCLDAMSAVTQQSVDEDHHLFALVLWPVLWHSSYVWVQDQDQLLAQEEYLSMVRKLLECDLEACFLKTFIYQRNYAIFRVIAPQSLYSPGRMNCIVPPSSRETYDSDTLTQQAVLRILTSAENIFTFLISQASESTIDVDPAHIILDSTFVSHLASYLLELRRGDSDKGVNSWESNNVIQSLKTALWREKRRPFKQLIGRLETAWFRAPGLATVTHSMEEVVNHLLTGGADVCEPKD
ncbi:hypothetical protein MD484_g3639, partial [Candolleomyces efflorescens]